MNTTKRPRPRIILTVIAIILLLSGDFLTSAAIFGLIWWLNKRAKENPTDAPLPPLPAEYYTPATPMPTAPARITPEQKYAIPTQRNHG